ncbi:DUF1353 domain-containing protein [Pseudomonas lactis]|uniref:DUF1353 domain-containing protein n=1 Tax=Pseudomonas TaxID=286 RepID=UPI000BB5D2A3|nr:MULTISPECIES: DUF1353 domain-containing protein [Pseudomonas]MBA5956229.1 DUF1353 domain-containing protein [Pseudomonas lactis]PRW80083.1 DUF1353 domain-containing protein [Pseudomonas fluorescens]PRW80858.1 DUF1353 domain-containing protein [Pseudomonas fluorescens]
MSRFTTTLKTEQTDRRTHTLLADLVLADDDERTIIVPSGFTTDFASIKVLHNAFLFVLFALVSGYGNYAATVHDFLYSEGQVSRKEADAVLYRALRAEGVARWRAYLFWLGVRIGGAKQYNSTPTSSGFSSSGDQ